MDPDNPLSTAQVSTGLLAGMAWFADDQKIAGGFDGNLYELKEVTSQLAQLRSRIRQLTTIRPGEFVAATSRGDVYRIQSISEVLRYPTNALMTEITAPLSCGQGFCVIGIKQSLYLVDVVTGAVRLLAPDLLQSGGSLDLLVEKSDPTDAAHAIIAWRKGNAFQLLTVSNRSAQSLVSASFSEPVLAVFPAGNATALPKNAFLFWVMLASGAVVQVDLPVDKLTGKPVSSPIGVPRVFPATIRDNWLTGSLSTKDSYLAKIAEDTTGALDSAQLPKIPGVDSNPSNIDIEAIVANTGTKVLALVSDNGTNKMYSTDNVLKAAASDWKPFANKPINNVIPNTLVFLESGTSALFIADDGTATPQPALWRAGPDPQPFVMPSGFTLDVGASAEDRTKTRVAYLGISGNTEAYAVTCLNGGARTLQKLTYDLTSAAVQLTAGPVLLDSADFTGFQSASPQVVVADGKTLLATAWNDTIIVISTMESPPAKVGKFTFETGGVVESLSWSGSKLAALVSIADEKRIYLFSSPLLGTPTLETSVSKLGTSFVAWRKDVASICTAAPAVFTPIDAGTIGAKPEIAASQLRGKQTCFAVLSSAADDLDRTLWTYVPFKSPTPVKSTITGVATTTETPESNVTALSILNPESAGGPFIAVAWDAQVNLYASDGTVPCTWDAPGITSLQQLDGSSLIATSKDGKQSILIRPQSGHVGSTKDWPLSSGLITGARLASTVVLIDPFPRWIVQCEQTRSSTIDFVVRRSSTNQSPDQQAQTSDDKLSFSSGFSTAVAGGPPDCAVLGLADGSVRVPVPPAGPPTSYKNISVTPSVPNRAVQAVAYHPRMTNYAIALTLDGDLIRLHDKTFQALNTGPTLDRVNTIGFSPCQSYLAAGLTNGKVQIWKLGDSAGSLTNLSVPQPVTQDGVEMVSQAWFGPSFTLPLMLAALGSDGSINIWAENKFGDPAPFSMLRPIQLTDFDFRQGTLTWAPDGTRLAVARQDGKVSFYGVSLDF